MVTNDFWQHKYPLLTTVANFSKPKFTLVT